MSLKRSKACSMPNHVVAIVQCRMGAMRLPNKMMLPLKGIPVIDWVAFRLRRAQRLDDLIFAVPDTTADDVLAEHLKILGVKIFRGSEKNVVSRFYQTAKSVKATHIVRVCADNPFIDAGVVDDLVDFYFKTPCDYAYNHIPRNNHYPDGLGAEIVSFEILKRIDREAKMPSQREHVLNYIWDNPEKFIIKTFDPADERVAHPELKMDIDKQEDYERLSRLPVRVEMTAEEIVKVFLEDAACD